MTKKTPSLYKQLMDTYFEWYQKTEGVKPRITAAEGAALKKLIKYLLDICGHDEAQVLNAWQVIFTNWHRLDEFYQKQKDLKQINSNINAIIRQIKSSRTNYARQSAQRHADDLREEI